MATFGIPPTVINLDDPSPGGGIASAPANTAAPTVIQKSATGDPYWDNFLQQQQEDVRQQKIAKLASDAKAAESTADNPSAPGIWDTAKAVPAAAMQILSHPSSFAVGAAGGLADVAIKAPEAIGKWITSTIYGSNALKGYVDLPLPGQTMDEYLTKNNPISPMTNKPLFDPDVLEASELAGRQAASYELGGAATRAAGFGTGLIGRIAGNVVGGQAVTDPNASLGDRARQAAFDAAFGGAEYGVSKAADLVTGAKAAQAVTNAKNSVITNAIDTFETPGTPAYNPDIGTKLRSFLASKTFDSAKTMNDFEIGMQNELGDSFYDPKVNAALQPIIDAGHAQVGQAVTQNPVPGTAAAGPIRPQDVFDTDTMTAKAEANANRKPPEVKYIAKDNLGKDPLGNKRLATTNVDTKTGNALVYYDKSLDANPESKQIVLDHEQGHILDKRLNGGNNLSAELPNYKGNKENLDSILSNFSKENQMTPQEAAAGLQHDIETLGGTGKPSAEAFADAVSMYHMDPKGASDMAPTFSKFMEYVPQESRFTEHSTTLESLKQDSPIAGKMLENNANKATAEARASKSAGGKIGSTGLKTGKTVEGKLSFNPDKINAPQDVEMLFSKMEAENKSFSRQRTAKSDEDIKDLARLVGLKEKDLINAKPGSIANAETLTAARQLVLNKAQVLADRLKSVDIENASDADLKALKDDYARMVAMQQTVAGFRTEAANTLRSLQIKISPDENFTLKSTFKKLQDAGIASKGDAGLFAEKIGKDFQQSLAGKIGQGALKTWYAAILSGPATPARHFIGVMSNLGIDNLSKLGNPKLAKEVLPAFKAIFKNVPEAYKTVKATWNLDKAGATDFNEIGKTLKPSAFPETGFWGKWGYATESVGRAMDSLASGYVQLAKAGEEASLKIYSPEMSQDLSDALRDAAANRINYLGEPRGTISKALSKGATALTKEAPALHLVVPFTHVVTNILDRQFDYLPGTSILRTYDAFGEMSHEVDTIMKKYGLEDPADRAAIQQRLKDQQMGRAITGMAITAASVPLAMAGLISGNGPSDYDAKIELERTGWRPNAVKIGDLWIPHIWFGPLGGILSMVGNIHDAATYDQNESDPDLFATISKGLLGFGQSQLDNSFLSGVSNLLGAISNPSEAQNYLKTFGTDLLPIPKLVTGAVNIYKGAKADITRNPANDPQYIDRGIVDQIRDNLGLEGNTLGILTPLEIKQNMFGEPMRADTIYGITPTLSNADMIDGYLQSRDIVITIPNVNQKYADPDTGKSVPLTPKQYTAYVKQSGQQIYKNLQDMIPSLKDEDIDSQRKEIKAMLDQVRTDTRSDVMVTIK